MRSYLIIFLVFMSWCCSSQGNEKQPRILIAYLSRTNNTKAIAEIIQQHAGGSLVAIELVKPYPEDYKTIVDQVAKEN